MNDTLTAKARCWRCREIYDYDHDNMAEIAITPEMALETGEQAWNHVLVHADTCLLASDVLA